MGPAIRPGGGRAFGDPCGRQPVRNNVPRLRGASRVPGPDPDPERSAAARSHAAQIYRSGEPVVPISKRMDDRPARPFFIRNLRAGELLERFLVSAVAAVLAVRFFLGLTGFPRLGGGGLHIAHMLWGGGLMVAALLVLLGYLGQRVRRTAAVVAGIGFGLFIDELGKFITSDNNYFFRPAIALIYVIFVLMFLWWRSLERQRTWSEETYLANALMLLQDTALHDLDPAEKYRLLHWLRRSGPLGTTVLGDAARSMAERPPDLADLGPIGVRLRWARQRIDRVLRARWTGRVAIAVLLLRSLGAVVGAWRSFSARGQVSPAKRST